MADATTQDLVQRVRALLAPGDIPLAGLIVHTEYGRNEEMEVHEETVHIGDCIAKHAGVDDWYVYSGNDDSEFASNQHQGLRIADDGFVWECQHLLRDEKYVIVMYFEAALDQDGLVEDLADDGYRLTSVKCPDQ